MNAGNTAAIVDTTFRSRLERAFSSDCHFNRRGDLVCSFSFQTARAGGVSKRTDFRVPASFVEDERYVEANATVALDRLFESIIR